MKLDVRLEGVAPPVGTLARFEHGGTEFRYDPDYLSQPGVHPISLSLPLRSEPFPDRITRSFFDNLLQENDQLRRTMDRERLGRDDFVGLLAHLGSDCAGALSCVRPNAPPAKVPGNLATDYEPLSPEQLDDYVDRLANRRPLPDDARDPSPVAGVQTKLSLCFVGTRLALQPRAGLGVPTTHILKVPHVDHPEEAELEMMSARLAEASGLDVAQPLVERFGGHTALIVPRFDRRIAPDGTVSRVHQEDFAQAMGLPPSLKYQRAGGGFDASSIAALLGRIAEPALARQRFLSATVFNLAIGNSDNHAKNHALLYHGGGAPRLAPLYDLMPNRLRTDLNPDFAFAIGDARKFEELRRGDLDTLLNAFGLAGAAARRFKTDELRPMLTDLLRAALRLAPRLADYHGLIMHQVAYLADLLDLHIDAGEAAEVVMEASD